MLFILHSLFEDSEGVGYSQGLKRLFGFESNYLIGEFHQADRRKVTLLYSGSVAACGLELTTD